MDATGWVAVAGIAGTLIAAVLAPLAAEHLRAKHAREEQLRTARLAVYGQFLAATARIVSNAHITASAPDTPVEETDATELDRLVAEIRVLGGTEVRAAFNDFQKRVVALHPQADQARKLQRRTESLGNPDSAEAMIQRATLASLANQIKVDESRLVAALHRDLGVTS